jgi:predicted phage baseplate assembly protein
VPLPLQDLDTRRYADLVDDAHALIPRYAPGWTDHNESDPGITLVELLAWLVEQDIYRVNRIPARHRLKFLELAGFPPEPPRAASAVLALTASAEVRIPPGTMFSAAGVSFTNVNRAPVPFTSVDRMRIANTRLAAVQSWNGTSYEDQTARLNGGVPFPAWGADPSGFDGEDPPALLLGFDAPLPGYALSLWLGFERGDDPAEPGLIAAEQAAEAAACRPLQPQTSCPDAVPPPSGADECNRACAGCLETIWELWSGSGWKPVQADDATAGLLLNGLVSVLAPAEGDPQQLGSVAQPLRWLRCRAVTGTPDAQPMIMEVAVNAVEVRQRVPATTRRALAPGAHLPTPPLAPGQRARLALEFDAAGQVTSISRTSARTVPKVRVLDVSPEALELTLAVAGSGLGIPELTLQLDEAPVADGEILVWSGEDDWSAERDLDSSLPRDLHFVLDPQLGVLTFGDGRRGLAPREGTMLLATYDVTLGSAGNVSASADWTSPAFDGLQHSSITPVGPATGGKDAEDLAHAAGRAAEALWAHERLLELAAGAPSLDGLGRDQIAALLVPQRAATTLDFERLALTVPGARVERSRAWAGIDAGLPGLRAPGTVTVVVVNSLPHERPEPTPCLIDRVERYLRRRKTLGTRLVVAGPEYVEVSATAVLAILPGAEAAAVTSRAIAALDAFLEPLSWPFGRDVFRAEVLAQLDAIPGVDAVASLELTTGEGEPSCGNVCLGPTQLAVSGTHTVQVAA